MNWYHIQYVFFLFLVLVLCLPSILLWLFVARDTFDQTDRTRLPELGRELKTLKEAFLESLEKWEGSFINNEATNGYDTSILQTIIETFSDIDENILYTLVNEHIDDTRAKNDNTEDIGKILENFEVHVGKLRTLDNLLMMKLQRKYSQIGMEKSLPWLGYSNLPRGKTWRFLQTNAPNGFNIVLFNNYNFNSLQQSLSSLATSVSYSFFGRSQKCLFVLGELRRSRKKEDVEKTLKIIERVRFCTTMIWRLDLETTQVTGSFSTWSVLMERIFGKKGTRKIKGFFDNCKEDILFLEENVILSEDALEVALFARLVKTTLSGIWQFALGGEGGGNTVNAHPDTFVVRKSGTFLGNAYGFNVTTWEMISRMNKPRVESEMKWNINLGKIIAQSNNMKGFLIVVPTLARFYIIRENGKILWSLATRAIDMESATVNKGIRDMYGFLCNPSLLVPVEEIDEIECACSSRRWNRKRSKKMYCSIQPFNVHDKCYSGNHLELEYS